MGFGSSVASQIFKDLDLDGDGRLSPSDCTLDFAGPMLVAMQSMAVAAPFLNEIRAKDAEIAFLKAKILSLGGDINDYMPLASPAVEITQQELEELLKSIKKTGWSIYMSSALESSDVRDAASKISYLWSKVLAKMFIRLCQISMSEAHDPESFFLAFKNACVESSKDLKTMLRPLFTVVPKGDVLIAIVDKIHNNVQSGDFDKELRDCSFSLFKVLDQNDDGKIVPADVTMYTDLFFAPCPDDESAKKKFMAIFDNLDRAKNGSLNQDEVSSFLSNITNFGLVSMIFSLKVVEVIITMVADSETEAMVDFYVQECKNRNFREVF